MKEFTNESPSELLTPAMDNELDQASEASLMMLWEVLQNCRRSLNIIWRSEKL